MARSLSNLSEGEGHNSAGMIDGAALKRYVERVTSLMGERDSINEDIKEIYDEAKSAGFVTKHLRQLCKEARMDQDELHDHLNHMDALRHALGEFSNTPLGEAAVNQATQAETPAARRRGRPPRSVQAIEQAHLSDNAGFEDPEARMDADLDRIIGEPAGAA